MDKYHALNTDTVVYNLKVRVVWFWGLIVRYETLKKEIPLRHNIIDYKNHWNKLINNKTPIK